MSAPSPALVRIIQAGGSIYARMASQVSDTTMLLYISERWKEAEPGSASFVQPLSPYAQSLALTILAQSRT